MIIKMLPKDAVYDFTDIFGVRHFHSKKREYLITRTGTIKSYPKSNI